MDIVKPSEDNTEDESHIAHIIKLSHHQIDSSSKMNLFTALKTMRQLSDQGTPFSFTFMSYSRSRQECHGIVEVTRAKLKPRAKATKYQNHEIIEEYLDLSTGEAKKFYQPTLMTFNGHRLTL